MENSITKLLKLEEKNVKIFEEVPEKTINNNKVFVLKGKLAYEINDCKCCKTKGSLIKHVYRKTIVKLPKMSD